MPRKRPPNDRVGDLGGWSLVSNNAMHEAQAKEFLDFLASLYGRAFAEDAARKAVKQAVAEGDSIVRVFRLYDATRIPKPDYVRQHEAHFRKAGREASTSGRRQMADHLAAWFERWSGTTRGD
jgi:hypothetical protein